MHALFSDVDKSSKKRKKNSFEQYSGEGVSISELMLQKKLKTLQKKLNLMISKLLMTGLKASKWEMALSSKKLVEKMCFFSASVFEDWLKTLPSLLLGYDPADISQADETSLFS